MDWTTDGRLIYTTSDTRSQYLEKINADGREQQSLTAPGNVDSVLTVSNDERPSFFIQTAAAIMTSGGWTRTARI